MLAIRAESEATGARFADAGSSVVTTVGTPPALDTRMRPASRPPSPAQTGSRCPGSNFRRVRTVRHTARSVARRRSRLSSACHPRRIRRTGCRATRMGRFRLRFPESAARPRPHRSQPDLIRGSCAGHENDVPAIGRDRHLCGGASASGQGTSKRRVLRRHDRELHRAGAGGTSPAPRKATTAMAIARSDREQRRQRAHGTMRRQSDASRSGGYRGFVSARR